MSWNISESIVTSPEPVMLTLAVPLSFLKPTDISLAIRPRQSNVIVCKDVMKVTFVSSGKV